MAGMRIFSTSLLLLASFPTFGQATGKVTFYAEGSAFKGAGKRALTLGIGKGDTASIGTIFDGKQKIALLTAGKFVTLNLQAGEHLFNANKAVTDGADDDTLKLDVPADVHLFVRLTTTSKGAWIVQAMKSHLELVTCTDARAEADGTKPVPVRLVQKDARSMLVDGQYFPQCDPK